jgi:hypothetical protein
VPCGVTSQALPEVVGYLSFGTAPVRIAALYGLLASHYGSSVFPDLSSEPVYAACPVDERLAQMTQKMSLGDAVPAVQIARFAPSASALVSWNAKHFMGKLTIPAITPVE